MGTIYKANITRWKHCYLRTKYYQVRTNQMVPCESTAEEVSFECSYHRISSTDSKVKTTNKPDGTTWKYCWRGFNWIVTPYSFFIQKRRSYYPFIVDRRYNELKGQGWGGGGGGGYYKQIRIGGLLFAEYVLLASQSPYPIIVYSVANYRPHLSHFWANM